MVLVITLLAMVVLLIGLVAILRTVDTAGLMVGNIAFRRDLTNRAEQAIAVARATLAGGSLSTTADNTTLHYSATKLANSSATGVPAILDNDDSSAGYNHVYGSDLAETTGDATIKLRYVIDRQCNSGTTTFGTSACEYVSNPPQTKGVSQDRSLNGSTRAIYRISVRVTGPRDTVAYFQTTYAN